MLRFFRKKSGPPSPSDVASRTLILKSQIVTGMASPPPEMLQHLFASWSPADREQFLEQCRQRQAQVADGLKETGVWSAMSLSERAFMLAPPNQIGGQALRNVSWLMESAVCLLWALGYVEQLPPYDTQSDIEHLKRLPSDGIVAVIRNATLRDAGAISRARDVAELWHWRSRTRQLQESGRSVELPNDLTLVDVIRMAGENAAAAGLFERAIEGDFPALGRSYAQLTADEWADLTSIAIERHKALNWLCGYAPGNRWEETPTDT
jgi:hypothetical protein